MSTTPQVKLRSDRWMNNCRCYLRVSMLFSLVLLAVLHVAQGAAQGVSFRSAQSAVGGAWQAPVATAVDTQGNLFVIDSSRGEIDEVQAVQGYIPASAAAVKVIDYASLGANSHPVALGVDSAGNLYVADRGASATEGAILQIAANSPGIFAASPKVTTLATGLNSPAGLTVDAQGNLFFAQAITGNHAIGKITATSVGVFVATPAIEFLGTGHSWNLPSGLALDASGNLLVAETGSGSISSIARSDGYTTVTQVVTGFTVPGGVAVDASGNLYVTDATAGTVTQLSAVNGVIPSSPTPLALGTGWSRPSSIASDSYGNLYVADASAQTSVVQLRVANALLGSVQIGSTSTKATLLFAFSANSVTRAPHVLTQGSSGLDFADSMTGSCTTQAGSTWNSAQTCTIDVVFTPTVAGAQNGAVQLQDASGNLLATAFVSGTGLGSVAGFSPGAVNGLSITGLGSTLLNSAGSPAFDAQGNLYLPDAGNNRLLKLAAPVAGSSAATVLASGLSKPSAAAMDGAGNLFLATGGNSVTELSAAGVQSTLSSGSLSFTNVGVAVDGAGNVYTADASNNRIIWFPKGGAAQVYFTGGALNQPYGVAADAQGNLFVANYGGNNVVKIANGVSTILSSTYLRNGSQLSYSNPMAIALDAVGNVYVADTGNNSLVMIPQGTSNAFALSMKGNITSLPAGVAVDRKGNLAVIDGGDNSIWLSAQQSGPSIDFASTAVGATSTKSSVALISMGNAPLTLTVPATGTNPSLSGNFTLLSSSNCPSLSAGGTAQTLAAGSYCWFDLAFAPQSVGAITGALTIADNASNGALQTVTLSGAGIAPSITVLPAAGTLTDGSVGTAFTQQFNASGGTAPYTYTLTATSGSMPAGLQFNATTGILSGTPTASGTVSFTLAVTDSSTVAEGGPFTSTLQTYTLTVSNPTLTIAPANLATGRAGVAFSSVSFTATGGTAPYTYALTSGALPAGMTFASGALAGTPTATGTYSFTITATDANGRTGNHGYSLVIHPPALALQPGSGTLDDATAENAYSQSFSPSGGTAPYTLTVSGGALPGGLTLSSAGLLSGTPTTTGTYTFTVQAADSTTGTGAPYITSCTYTLTVYAPIISVIPLNAVLNQATAGQTNYAQMFTAKGGNGTYTYALSAGTLPTGMSLAGGLLSGIPKSAGNWTFTITATDSNLFAGSKTYTLSVGSPSIIVTPANPVLSAGVAESVYSGAAFGATSSNGGTAPYTYAITSGTLPAGMSLNGNLLSGIPTASGTFYLTVTATDANQQTGSRVYALTIAPPVVSLHTATLLDAAVGLRYRQVLTASGGSGTYVYTANGLPSWLTLDTDGALHGVPQAADTGANSFNVTATDANGFSASRAFTVNVYAFAAVSSGTQNLGKVKVGSAATTTLTFNFNGNFALGSTPVKVVTQGASGRDFSSASNSTCATGIVYGANATSCTVVVSFAPAYPGLRKGSVQLIDGNGNILAVRAVYGFGKGALATFLPGTANQLTSGGTLRLPQGLAVDTEGAVYVTDILSKQVVKIAGGSASVLMNAASGLGVPGSVALDGAGNLFISDADKNMIWKIAAGSATPEALISATIHAPALALRLPQGLAVDGAGNLYIVDTGNSRILVSTLTDSGYTTPEPIPTVTPLQTPMAVSVGYDGTIYVSDAAANMVLVEPAGGTQTALGNAGSETKITSDMNAPSQIALDGNGNLYIANHGANNILKVAASAQGGFETPVVLTTAASPSGIGGIALGSDGTLYLSDEGNGVVYAENNSVPPSSLAFTTATGVGSQDVTDGAKSFTVTNFGNEPLDFVTGTGIVDATNSFVLDSQTNCNRQSSDLAANASCVFAFDFVPTQVGAPLTASFQLIVDGSNSGTHTVALSGTSLNSFVFSPAAGALTAGVVGGAYSQTIAVTNGGSATYTYRISSGALPPGLALTSGGVLSGTPTQPGSYSFLVTATNNSGNIGSAAYTLAIAADATATTTQDSPTQQTVTFTFTRAVTLAQVRVLTQGETGLDFTNAGTGTCGNPTTNYNSGDSCIVVVKFTASSPGTHYGAVQLLDASSRILATNFITGVGTAPLALFSPGTYGSLQMSGLSSLGSGDGLKIPAGMAVDPLGNLYLADVANHRILKITSNGAASEVATGNIVLHYPTGVALDGAGNLYIADNGDGKVVQVSHEGVASVLDNGALTLTNNFSVAVDGSGTIYTTDSGSSQLATPARIVKYPAGGTAQSLTITGATLTSPTGLAVDGSGTLWIADGASILAVHSGVATALATGTLSPALSEPLALAVDGPGNLYIADGGNSRVLMLPAGSADLGSAIGIDVGSLDTPIGLAVFGAGDLYVSDAQRNSVVHSAQQTPSALNFDAVVGATSAPQNILLLNAGNSSLTMAASASASNPTFLHTPSAFALNSATTCAQLAAGATDATVLAGKSCLYALQFAATSFGVATDELTLTDNSNNVAGATQKVALSGATIAVSPNSGSPATAYALPAGTQSSAYNSALATTFTASGGHPPYCFGLAAGSLPKGMSLSSNGVLWGTPASHGSFTFTVKASDSYGQFGTQVYSLTIAPAVMTLTPAAGALSNGAVQTPYSQLFQATGGTAPYSYSLTSGTLPLGLELSRGGLLTGVPAVATTSALLTVMATDAQGQTVSASYTLTVAPPPIAISPSTAALPGASALIVYSQLFTANNGTMPYSFAVSSGALPAGMTLDPSTGLLAGVPTVAGAYSFTVMATDSSTAGPFSGSQSYTLNVAAPLLTLTPASLANGAVGEVYRQQLSASGGAGPYQFSVSSGTLPAGLTLSATGLLAGTPTSAGVKSFTLTATDTVTGATAQLLAQPTIFLAPATAPPVAFATAQSVGTWSSSSATVTYTFHGTSSVNSFAAVTNGIANLEFKWAHSGSCTITEYNDGDTCTLDFTFKPRYPWQRIGAIELLDPSGVIVGTALVRGTGNAAVASVAPGTEATLANAGSSIAFAAPRGMVVDAADNVYIADSAVHAVLKVTPAGTVSKVLDLASVAGTPTAVAVDGAGNLFAADTANATIWRQAPPYTATPTVVVSSAVNTPAAGLGSLGGLALNANGSLYFTVPSANQVYTLPALPATGYGAPVQLSTASALLQPTALAVDASGNLYIADAGNNRIVLEPAGGGQETVIGSSLSAPSSLAVDGNGNVYVANSGTNTVLKATLNGSTYSAFAAVATTGTLQSANAVTLDGRGNLYIADGTAKALLEENYGAPRPLRFAKKTIVQTIDTTDGTVDYTFFNAGNTVLSAVSPGLDVAPDFPLTAGSGTPANCTASFALASNDACALHIGFKPTTVGTLNEAIVFTDNSLEQTSASQQIALSGTGLPVLQMSWATPAAINYGTPLSATQLNADTGPVSGTFTYTPAAGALLNAGTQTLSVLFTPTDLVDYSPLTATVSIVVNPASTTTSLRSSTNPSLYRGAVTLTATVTPTAGVATGPVNFYDGATSLGSATLSNGTATFSISSLSAGIHALSAVYVGDISCISSTSSTISQQVIDFTLASSSSGSGDSTQAVAYDGTASYSLTIAPNAGATLPSATTLTVSGLPGMATASLTGAGWTQQSSTSWVLPANTPLSVVNLAVQLHTSASASSIQPTLVRRGSYPLLLGLLVLPLAARLRRTGKRFSRLLPLIMLVVLASILSSCTVFTHVIPRSYNIVVTVQSGTLTHSTTLELKVE